METPLLFQHLPQCPAFPPLRQATRSDRLLLWLYVGVIAPNDATTNVIRGACNLANNGTPLDHHHLQQQQQQQYASNQLAVGLAHCNVSPQIAPAVTVLVLGVLLVLHLEKQRH